MRNKRVDRPWGNYTSINHGDGFQVKRIVVKPGQRLSLQYHHHRNEHWVVTAGKGKIVVGDLSTNIKTGFYVMIQKLEPHRLINDGDEDLVIIEIQMGSYLGEDDIVRLQDDYGRVE